LKTKIALLISYDGSDFAGWQRQNGDRTVQEEIEKALQQLTGQNIPIAGSGRTDSGVHASGQVAHFELQESNIPAEKFHLALNSRLPRDIRILKSRQVDEDFHSRFSARRREYGYYLYNQGIMPAHMRKYCYAVRHPLNLKTLNRLAEPLTGIHDFSTFTAAGDQSKSRIREIFQARFIQQGSCIIFRIAGNAFLWRMVRSLTGTLVDLAKQGADASEMEKRLLAKDREAAGPTAPPWGLFLENIDYGSAYRFY